MTGEGNIALATVQDPWAYIAVLAVGLLAFGIRAMVKGDLRTLGEVTALLRRAETAEAALRIRDEQIDRALGVLPQLAEVLEKFHVAGEQVRMEREDGPS